MVLTSARPVVRAGAVRLQCETCDRRAVSDEFDSDSDSDDYDAIFVSEPDSAILDNDDSSKSVAGGVYGASHGSASGAIEAKRPVTRPDATPPAVIITTDRK